MKLTYAQTFGATKTPKFHVGIPTLRRYDLLERCLSAILASTLRPESILVLDNGGKYEPSQEVAPRIKIVTPGYNLGVPASWNFIQKYFDEDVYILNDDIFVQPQTFEVCQSLPGWFVTGYQFGCFCARRLCLSAVGEFDEDLWPMYWEDYDYITRMERMLTQPAALTDNILVTSGAVVSAQNIPHARPENFELGAKSEQPWMYPFKNRIASRYSRKWGNNLCAQSPFLTPYGDKGRDCPILEYRNVLHGDPNNQALMDAVYNTCKTSSSVVELGGSTGASSVEVLRAGVGRAHFFHTAKRPEWDIIPCLARKVCRFEVRTAFTPDVILPSCDTMIIHGSEDPAYVGAFLDGAFKVSKYLILVGDEVSNPDPLTGFTNLMLSGPGIRVYNKVRA